MPEKRNLKQGRKKISRLNWLVLLTFGVLLASPLQAMAAELVTNGIFNGSTSWTFDAAGGNGTGVTNAYDSTTTRTGGSGSVEVYIPTNNRNKTGQGVIRQNVSIAAGSTINTVSLYAQIAVDRSTGDNVTVDLRYADTSTVNLLTTAEISNTSWQQFTASPGLTLAQNVDQIIVTLNAANANSTTTDVRLWADEISIDYTAGAGCTTAVPTLDLGAGVSIGASASTQYTITVTNNDSGAGCSDRSFDIVWQSDNMSPTDGSFSMPSSLSGTCAFTLAATNSSTTCLLDVTSTAGAINGTTLTTTVIDNTSNETGSVVTTISTGGFVGPLDCDECHGSGTGTGENYPTDSATRTIAGATPGSHAIHSDPAGWLTVNHSVTCTTCHPDDGPNTATHRNGNVETLAIIASGFYDKNNDDANNDADSWIQTTAPSLGNCDNTSCHGSNQDSPVWGTAGPLGCDDCHGNGAGQNNPDGSNIFRTSAASDGFHAIHMAADTGSAVTETADFISGGVQCIDCHVVPTATSDANHFEIGTTAEVTFANGDGALKSYAIDYTSGTCSTYCHDGSVGGTATTPNWTTGSATVGCSTACHGLPPNTGGHASNPTMNECSGCHDHVNADATTGFSDVTKHINGSVDGGGHSATGDCVTCHDTAKGSRREIDVEFNLTRQHGNTWNNLTKDDCNKCHEETTSDGTVLLKVWDAAGTGYSTVTYDKANLASANNHCISCHDTTRNVTINGASPPARSMVNFTSTQTYRNHNFITNGATGAVVPEQLKAISPHGNPGNNELKGAESTVTSALGCLHCHPSHGSSVASKTATSDAVGNAVNARMLGGNPSALASVGLDYGSEGGLSDPDLCWGCHDSVSVADYYGDTTTGHWNGGTWKNPSFSYKTGKGGVVVKHIANKVDGGTADDNAANIVCTTCHDVHGSPTVAQFYSPALKGKWLTSPYYEDRAPPAHASASGTYAWANADSSARSFPKSPRAAIETGTAWAPKEIGGGYGTVGTNNGAWGWFIDGNTFGMSAYRAWTDGAVTQKYMSDLDATAGAIGTFAGLCMTQCHSAANIESRTAWTGHNPVVPGFGGSDAAKDLFNVNGTAYPATGSLVRNQMVGQGWYNDTGWGQNLFAQDTPGERQGGDGGALDAKTYSHSKAFSYGVNPTAAGAQAGFHKFSCSKCHNPHASELPALMRTNCLDTKHSSFEYRMAAEANNCHRVEDSGAAIIGPGDPYNGNGWNSVTPW